MRHVGVVWMAGLGKALFAMNLAYMMLMGWTSYFALLVVIGDALFVAAFVAYFVRLRRSGASLI